MSNGIKGYERRRTNQLDSLNNLINLYGNLVNTQNIDVKNKAVFLTNSLENVNSLEGLNNLIPTLEEHNQKAEYSGNEVYSINYGEKENLYKGAVIGYNSLKPIQDMNLQEPEELALQLLSGGWGEFANQILKLDNIDDAISEADKFGYRFTPTGNYTEKSLKSALKTRRNALNASFEVLDQYEGTFNIINEDGTRDEASQMLFDKLKYSIATGDTAEVASTISTGTTRSISGYNKYSKMYTDYGKIEMQLNDEPKKVSDLGLNENILFGLNNNGYSGNDYLDPEFVTDMKQMALENAKNFNFQHKVYNGQLFDENPIWKRQGLSEEDFINMGIKSGPTLNALNTYPKDSLEARIADTSELTEEQKAKLKGETIKEDEPEDVSPVEETIMSTKEPQIGSEEYKRRQQTTPKFLPVDKGAFNESFKKILKIDNIEKHIAKNIPDKYKGEDYEGGYPWYILDELNKLKRIINRFKSGKSTGGSARIAAVKKYNKILEFSENLK